MVSIQSERRQSSTARGIEVDRVDAALDHVPAQAGLQTRLEVVVVRSARYLLVAQSLAVPGLPTSVLKPSNHTSDSFPARLDPSMMAL